MAKITGGELVVRVLRQSGVETIFGLHGAHIDTIFQAALDHGMPVVDTRHEAAAGHAAEGYARAGNQLGVALVTAGGGFTNVMTPLANAHLDRTPMLVLTGSGALRDAETNTLQAGIDQVAMAVPVTRWAYRITAVDQIPRLLTQAIRIALSPPRGPVLIDLPWDVLTGEIDEADVPIESSNMSLGQSEPSAEWAEKALDLLEASARPVILVGSEVARGKGHDALNRLARQVGWPVFADYEGSTLLSGLGDLKGGFIQNLYGFNDERPDAVLMLGLRFGLHTWHGAGTIVPRDATVVQVDPDARELGRLQPVALGLAGDPAATLDALDRAAARRDWRDRGDWRRTVAQRVAARATACETRAHDRSPVHPWRAVNAIADRVGSDTIVVADGATSYLWMTEAMHRVDPAAFLTHGYLGSMGVGFGVAVGAQRAAPDKRVIFVTGDGSVGFSIAEFDTLVRHRLPVIVVVLNNRSWGATLHFQQFAVGANRITNTRLENGAYEEVARAFGAGAHYAETLEDFTAALDAALAQPVASCINLRVDLDAIPPEEMVLMGQDPFAA